jgi:prepilin-type N-terminal cleavage/methylation domain-containing protein
VDAGFSLIELLVAMAISLAILGAAFTVVGGWQTGFGAETERADEQQRLRVAVDAISRDLTLAGAGPHLGLAAGSLGFSVASLFPFRQGALSPDVPGTARTDTLTVLYVLPQTTAQTTIRQAVAARSGTAIINHDAGCPLSDAACGFVVGADVMVYDDSGSYDTFRVTAVQPGALELQHTMPDTSGVYAAGARIVEAASHTYTLKIDPVTDSFQLVRYDGVSSDAAVVDHVVGLSFDYFGDSAPPLLIRPVTEPAGPWTSYGPKPPRLNVRSTAYPAGENCAFQVDAASGLQVARLPQLGNGSTTLVKLTAAELTDGPWCPDDTNPHRYDADLLRIRRVSVTLRVEASLSALRGPAGILFARGGTSRSAARWVSDQEIRFDIAPQNLNLTR